MQCMSGLSGGRRQDAGIARFMGAGEEQSDDCVLGRVGLRVGMLVVGESVSDGVLVGCSSVECLFPTCPTAAVY